MNVLVLKNISAALIKALRVLEEKNGITVLSEHKIFDSAVECKPDENLRYQFKISNTIFSITFSNQAFYLTLLLLEKKSIIL